MRFIQTVAATAVLSVLGSGALLAQQATGPKIYAYHTANYCPTGLQPITINGTTCCGVPNQDISYAQALSHPVSKKRHVHRVAKRADCPVGTKGCTFD